MTATTFKIGMCLVIIALGQMVISSMIMAGIVTPTFAEGLQGQSYYAILEWEQVSDLQEVLPSDQEHTTNASGIVRLNDNVESDQLSYQVNLTSIDKVIMVDIHRDSVTGPVIAMLFMSSSLPTEEVNGVLTEGNIMSSDLQGPLEDKSNQDLIRLFREQKAFVTVHTSDVPSGELIGTIISSNSSTIS